MQAGRIEQLGVPEEIYRQPANLFVAQFMGTTNVLAGIVGPRTGGAGAGAGRAGRAVGCGLDAARGRERQPVPASRGAAHGQRRSSAARRDEPRLEATVVKAEFIGALSRLDVELADGMPLKVAVLDDRRHAR